MDKLYYSCDGVLLDFIAIPTNPLENLQLNNISNLQDIKQIVSKKNLYIAKNRLHYFWGFNMDNKGLATSIRLVKNLNCTYRFNNLLSRIHFIRNYWSDNLKDYIDYNFKEVKNLINLTPSENNSSQSIFFNNSYKFEIVSLFLINDIILNITPNYFRKQFKKNYTNLNKVLQDDRIVSVMIKVKLSNGNYRCLGNQFGFKFNFKEFNTWNFAKSPYINMVCKYFHNIYLPF